MYFLNLLVFAISVNGHQHKTKHVVETTPISFETPTPTPDATQIIKYPDCSECTGSDLVNDQSFKLWINSIHNKYFYVATAGMSDNIVCNGDTIFVQANGNIIGTYNVDKLRDDYNSFLSTCQGYNLTTIYPGFKKFIEQNGSLSDTSYVLNFKFNTTLNTTIPQLGFEIRTFIPIMDLFGTYNNTQHPEKYHISTTKSNKHKVM